MHTLFSIVGLIYLLRKPRLQNLKADNFPQVAPDVFEKWRELELESMNLFLWATWGLIGFHVVLNSILSEPSRIELIVMHGGLFIAFLVLIICSAIPGNKAAKLKKEHGIKWP